MLDFFIYTQYHDKWTIIRKGLLMKKLFHNRNFYLLLLLIVVIIAVLLASKVIDFSPKDLPTTVETLPTATPVTQATEAPAATAAPAEGESAAIPTGAEVFTAPGYVYIVASGEGRWFALPDSEPGTITVKDEDRVNVIRLTSNGVMMESSTCDNQDCVNQGEVTLENLSDRVLYNMILCLPHSVSIELYSQQEMIMMYDAQMATAQQ